MKPAERVPKALYSSRRVGLGAAGALTLFVSAVVTGCSGEELDPAGNGGQSGSTGGGVTGGQGGTTATGGQGGTQPTGGTATGGVATGGVPTGGAPTGGVGGSGTGGGGAGAVGGSGASGAGGDAGAGGSVAGMGGQSGGRGGAGSGGMAGSGASGAGGSGGSGGSKSTGCGKAPGIASGMYNNGTRISITAANIQRRYILNVPTNYDNTKPYKLIIAFHQRDGNDVQMYQNQYYHLLNLSGNNAIFVAPNGQKNGSPCTATGNGDGGCGWPNPSGQDVALADAVVAQVKENFCVDNNRIFATGWSYGGSMSYRTACDRGLGGTKNGVAGYIRGIAVYSGAQLSGGNCTPTTPVAYYGSHGDTDSVLPYDGGVSMAQNFAMPNGCTWATPTKVTSGNHQCTDIMGCRSGYPVKFCSFDGDHTPDPRDPGMGSGSWQYQLVWDFFNQF